MHLFNHTPGPTLPTYEKIEIKGKRYYVTPEGNFPSVTTVLGAFTKDSIKDWQKAVGMEEAERVRKKASRRGTEFHALAEDYISNKPIPYADLNPMMRVNFKSFAKALDRIDNIRYIEATLCSPKLGIAGQTDCIADFDNVLSIIDYKSSLRNKNEEDIQSYFEQETAYGLMFYHTTGIPITQIVTLMQEDYNPEPKVFIKRLVDYIVPLKAKIREYNNMKE